MDETALKRNISAVERETGLSKDTLRVWERRYGFPRPLRDANGERVYPLRQVQKLRLVKRLMDRGRRPGKIIALPIEELVVLGGGTGEARERRQEIELFIRMITAHQLPELRRHLCQTLMKQGLEHFIVDTVAPLNEAVGEAWMRGDFAVFDEHLYSELMQSLLRSAIGSMQPLGRTPRVLLTTFPNESHGLGLLMAEALLAVEGVSCVPLGTQTPLAEIARAALAHRIDIVALSFSAAFNAKQAAAGLAELRLMLPEQTLVWAGGAGVTRLRKGVKGVALIGDVGLLVEKIKAWRACTLASSPSEDAPGTV